MVTREVWLVTKALLSDCEWYLLLVDCKWYLLMLGGCYGVGCDYQGVTMVFIIVTRMLLE